MDFALKGSRDAAGVMPMRYLAGVVCVFALGMMPVVGCGPGNGGGGNGGSAGSGGTGGGGTVECQVANDCLPGGECTVTVCAAGMCDTQTAEDGTVCDHSGPGDGQCKGGTCGPSSCAPACTDPDEDDCTEPFCPEGATECSTQPRPEHSDCRENGAVGQCTVDGRCVQCNVADDCESGGECTVTACAAGACDTQTAQDGTSCDHSAPGDGTCTGGTCGPTTCVPACVDLDEDDCTEPICLTTVCSTQPVPEDSDCRENGANGKCTLDGRCDLCADVMCTAPSQCQEDSSCNEDTGACLPFENKNQDTPCTEDDGSYCDGHGRCVQCNVADHCDPGGECTTTVCNAGTCDTRTAQDGTTCDYSAPGVGTCVGGTCGPTTCVPACVDPDEDDCTEVFCPPRETQCSTQPSYEHSDCDEDGGSYCDADGNCVQCTALAHCNDSEECTDDDCTVANRCVNAPWADGEPCSQGACLGGVCGNVFPCTEQGIRDAIAKGGGPYRFDCPPGGRTIETNARITITNDVILDGEQRLILDGQGTHSLFTVPLGVKAHLTRMDVLHGSSVDGGCIFNVGTLELETVVLRDCVASGDGGAIYNRERGEMELTGCRVGENKARYGGGIYNSGSLTVRQSTLDQNEAGPRGAGGAIYNRRYYTPATLTLIDSALVGNAVLNEDGNPSGGAGAIFSTGADSELINTTVTQNAAWAAGAIHVTDADLTLIASTVAWNWTAYQDHPDIRHTGDGSLVVWNTAIVGDDCDVASAAWVVGSHSVESPGNTCRLQGQLGCHVEIPEAALALGPLAPNGWPVWSFLPAANSFLVNKTPPEFCPTDADQRTVPRPQGGSCDIGSVERSPADP